MLKKCHRLREQRIFRFTKRLFLDIGMKNEKNEKPESLHSPFFQLNEEVLPYGAAMHASLAATYLLESQSHKDEL
ncbi:hypothetical protein HanHA300_Chr02g0038001 [Helianthus annuus]|nr:hypothetical protein HanHA300_Chr02g0038001 [Helianthus annuus]KAJ0785124.1 hypothetical protein HanOQP8_Chr02g0039431 [Helianthus annuus]